MLWGEVGLTDHSGWSDLLLSPADGCFILQLQLFDQFLPQQCGEVQFLILSSHTRDQLFNPLPALLWRWLVTVFVYWDFHTVSFFLCLAPFFSVRLCCICPFCCPVLLHFVVYFSVFQRSSGLDAAPWLKRRAL
jgi:hypothetical protein